MYRILADNESGKSCQILSRVIDTLQLWGKCNIPFCNHKENEGSNNKGIFLELVNYTRKIDAAFNSYMKEGHVFKGTVKKEQNECLQCQEHTVYKIKKPRFCL